MKQLTSSTAGGTVLLRNLLSQKYKALESEYVQAGFETETSDNIQGETQEVPSWASENTFLL